MFPKQWIRPPFHLLWVFLSVTLFLAAALGWLGWRILEQDRALSSQRTQERVEVAAGLITATLQKNLSDLEQGLAGLAGSAAGSLARESSRFADKLPGDSVLLIFDADDVEPLPADRLLFRPSLPPPKEPPAGLFMAAEEIEFKQGDYLRAASASRGFVRAADPQIRAAAWMRVGRNLRRSRRWEEAIQAYAELRALGPVAVGGLPAELLARDALCSLLEERGDRMQLREEASALLADLGRGRWKIDEAAYIYYSDQARQRAGEVSGRAQPPAVALSKAAQVLWSEWERVRQGEAPQDGRRIQWLAEQPLLLAWRSSGYRMAGMVAGSGLLKSVWLDEIQPILVNHRATLSLIDTDGRPFWGDTHTTQIPAAVRLASATRLPWVIHISSAANPGEDESQTVRRRLLTTVFCLVVVLVISGGYFIGRAVTRECRVAQQQSDFVAAVSHEFRTPLTSLCQFTELLAKGRVEGEEDRRRFYAVLARESQRLRRLVEGLLNFGRLEAGALDYRFEKLDPADLTRQVVGEFEAERNSRDHRFECSADGSLPPVRADRAALGCVIWNLLDNAVKYSPDQPEVHVRVGQAGNRIRIAVRDDGAGIVPAEREGIFRKFTRGSAARDLHVRGTGIGLAMAHQIIQDHDGEITVESEPGKGSTFTIYLPVARQS